MQRVDEDGCPQPSSGVLGREGAREGEEEGGREVQHVWFYGWKDFAVPGKENDEVVLSLVAEAVQYIR
jgi:hypothetical protein